MQWVGWMNITVASYVKYRGRDFWKPWRTIAYGQEPYVVLNDFVFLDVQTADGITPFQIDHGYIDEYTRNIVRPIEMIFTLYGNTEQERFDLIKEMSALFEPPRILSPEDRGYYDIEFCEPNWMKRTGKAKVSERPTHSDYRNCKRVQLRVVLYLWSEDGCHDTCFVGDTLFEKDNVLNQIEGICLPDTLERPFDYKDLCIVNYEWVSDAPVTVTITATEDVATPGGYLLVKVLRFDWTERVLRIDWLNMNTWDVVVVDWRTSIITLNGFDISGQTDLAFEAFPFFTNGILDDTSTWNNAIVIDTGDAHQKLTSKRERKDYRC